MKRVILTMIVYLMVINSYSQTSRQTELVTKFFNNSGGNILQDAAHPACTWSYATVQTYSGHIYYISLHYKQVLTSKEFTCQYKLEMSHAGKFLSLVKVRCNCPDFNCFGLCRTVSFTDITTYDDRIRYEKYTGVKLEDMSCEEYANVKLFFKWYDLEYYSNY